MEPAIAAHEGTNTTLAERIDRWIVAHEEALVGRVRDARRLPDAQPARP